MTKGKYDTKPPIANDCVIRWVSHYGRDSVSFLAHYGLSAHPTFAHYNEMSAGFTQCRLKNDVEIIIQCFPTMKNCFKNSPFIFTIHWPQIHKRNTWNILMLTDEISAENMIPTSGHKQSGSSWVTVCSQYCQVNMRLFPLCWNMQITMRIFSQFSESLKDKIIIYHSQRK